MVDINVSGNSLHAKEYITAFDLELQQSQSKLEPFVFRSSFEGNAEKRQAAVRYGEVSMSKITGSYDDITDSELSSVQRWITGDPYDVSSVYNEYTQGPLTKQNIQQAIVMAQMAAVERQKDEIILSSIFDPALSGADAGSTTAYDSGNTISASVGASGNTGLNLAKIEAVKDRMKYNELDPDTIAKQGGAVMILTEKSSSDLRKMVEVNNADYRAQYGVKTDSLGNVIGFYGFDIIEFSTARLAKYKTSARLLNGALRRIPVFTKKALQLGMWASQLQRVSDVDTKRGAVKRFYAALNLGATRLDEKLVYDIQVAE
ncbi:MAG: hypothetical protein EBU90_31620 [Proteobacteria bacterium]|nr:hypothetical protein [Pseudomonadota bacterium]NBP16419.1 hypothetical protein [bacterium]